MTRTIKFAAAITALTLAACAGQQPTTSAPATARLVPNEMPYRAGIGKVTAATRAATAPHRLLITMNDGSTQVVDTDAADIAVGSRVELTPDRVIRKL